MSDKINYIPTEVGKTRVGVETRSPAATVADTLTTLVPRSALDAARAELSTLKAENERLRGRIAEIACGACADYPHIQSIDAIEQLWAIESSHRGLSLALDDWASIASWMDERAKEGKFEVWHCGDHFHVQGRGFSLEHNDSVCLAVGRDEELARKAGAE